MGCVEEIKSDEGLLENSIPNEEREIWISGADAGNQMVFESSDGSFGGVAAMRMWWHQLVINAFLSEKVLESGGGIIVEFFGATVGNCDQRGFGALFPIRRH